MNRVSITAAVLAAAVAGSPAAAVAKEYEAVEQSAQAAKLGRYLWVVAAGKQPTPVAGGIVSALRGRLSDLGYGETNFPEQHELGKGQTVGTAHPSIGDLGDAQKWLKGGHKVHAAITGGLIGIATAAHATEVTCNGMVVVEAQLMSGGKGLLGKIAKKAGVPGADKAKGDEVYQYRMTALDEKGEVAWSAVDTVNKAELEKRIQEAQDKKTDEMVDKVSAAAEHPPAPTADQQAAADKAKADMMDKLTPEQKAQMAQMQGMMPGGQMPAAPTMPSGLMKNMMKMTAKAQQKPADAGGPEKWGQFIVEDQWSKLSGLFPSLK